MNEWYWLRWKGIQKDAVGTLGSGANTQENDKHPGFEFGGGPGEAGNAGSGDQAGAGLQLSGGRNHQTVLHLQVRETYKFIQSQNSAKNWNTPVVVDLKEDSGLVSLIRLCEKFGF